MNEPPVLQLDHVARTYEQGGLPLAVIRDATLTIRAGDLVGLQGPSGAGKSTLLHVAGLLEMPDGGEVGIAGQPCGALSDGARTELRRNEIGFVYQFHHLLPEFSALENVMLPQLIAGRARLSGGEQQRVAIARALANEPRLLLADEPTGNLDAHTAAEVLDLFLSFVRGIGLAALIATHNLDLAARLDRTVRIEDGILVAGHQRV